MIAADSGWIDHPCGVPIHPSALDEVIVRFPSVFTDAQIRILDDLHQRDQRERVNGVREPLSIKAVAPSVAQLLYLLVVGMRAKTIVEFGTSHGYSTIHLAAAAERTDGHVYTVDILPQKTAWATANLEAAGLLHRVTLATADGADFVQSLPTNVDFVLVDYGVEAFARVFSGLRDRLAPGGLMFVDGGPDGYWDQEGPSRFKALLEDAPAWLTCVLPMHKDQLLVLRLDP